MGSGKEENNEKSKADALFEAGKVWAKYDIFEEGLRLRRQELNLPRSASAPAFEAAPDNTPEMQPLPSLPLTKRGKAGRPRGAGGWAESDAPLVEKMREMIADNPDMTPHRAAVQLTPEAAGASNEAKARRLADRYRKKYGDGN